MATSPGIPRRSKRFHPYWRPDIRLDDDHPDYPDAADSTCQNNGLPESASMLDVNEACNTLSTFTTWHWQTEQATEHDIGRLVVDPPLGPRRVELRSCVAKGHNDGTNGC